jgi:riboflavin kinase/FMN adenylyltransferase
MELVRGLINLHDRHRGCVVTVGNFDGVHRGHQALVARAQERARALGVPAVALTFEPTPREFLTPDQAPPRVHTFRDKAAALAATGLDRLVVARFSRELSHYLAESFIDDLLVKRLGIRGIVVGEDFRYGRGRSGSIDTLREHAQLHGFEVQTVENVVVQGERCSSTALREALAVPDLARTERLLGRPYTIRGIVRRGLQLGRKLGMPTANIHLRRPMALREGVYAVRGHCDGQVWDGVASLGVRPTLGLTRCLLEAHLFAATGSLYGRELQVEFRAFLRPQVKFDSLDELSERMQQDATQARELLGTIG